MTTALTFLILIAPFAVAAALSWAAHRTAPKFTSAWFNGFDDDRDSYRMDHDANAIRTRFEQQPFWPASGVLGERR